MTDLTTYAPPGVYVEDVSREVADAINPLLNDEILCIVAPAQGYVTATENLTLSSTVPTTLANKGVVNDASLVVKTAGSTVLVKDVDYSVTVDNTVPGATVTTLLRLPITPGTISPGGLANNGPVTVSYRYADATYFQPKIFSDYSSLAKVYGPGLSSINGSNTVLSPLSLASQIAFENGASRIMAVAVNHNTASWDADFASAYSLIATDHRVSILVPVFPDTAADSISEMNALMTSLRLHVDETAANGFGRIVLASAARTYDDVANPFESIASAVSNTRIVAVYPTRYTMFNANLSQSVEVGGGYMAAALGGRLVLNEVQRGLTRQVMNSLTGIPAQIKQRMSRAFMDNLAQSGVTVMEVNRNNRLVCRHGLTTDTTSLFTKEISLVRVADVLLADIQVGLENTGLVGSPIDDEMSTRVKSNVIGILEAEVAEQVIVTYNNVLVRQQALPNGDPSVIEIQFSYKPAVPLNYITVAFSLDLNSGAITTSEDDVEGIPTTG